MDFLKAFNPFRTETVYQHSDFEDCDNFCQSLINLTKLIEEIKVDGKISKFYNSKKAEFDKLIEDIEYLNTIVPKVYQILHNFDFRDVKFNGYRSYFNIVRKCVKHIDFLLRKFFQFRLDRSMVESNCLQFCRCLSEMTSVSGIIYEMMLSRVESKTLYLKKSDDEVIYNRMLEAFNNFNSDSFYGHCLGFYLCESCQVMAKFLCSLQLGLGQAMTVPKSSLEVFVATIVSGTQNLLWESKRGSQMGNLYKQATVTFCKQFWNLCDHPILLRWSHLVLPFLKVIQPITLPPVAIPMRKQDNSDVTESIFPPRDLATDEFVDTKLRLLSSKFREGMSIDRDLPKDNIIDPPSKFLLIHCHGGGFVAQSSQSHDGYLRQWAINLDCPIVSVDYSHAPEHPFPRAHEECFFAYCWAIEHLQQLGCSEDCRVVICGDSAGGNLALSCVVRALQLNIRLPEGVFVAYPAACVEFMPSPARILGLIDPILPIGVLARCLLAYVGINEDCLVKSINDSSPENMRRAESNDNVVIATKSRPLFLEKNTFNNKGKKIFYSKSEAVNPLQLLQSMKSNEDALMSPLLASDDICRRFPPLSVIASEYDPLLDDSVELCKRIDSANGQFVKLQVAANMPHGFLSMSSPVTRECSAANKASLLEIRQLLDGTYRSDSE